MGHVAALEAHIAALEESVGALHDALVLASEVDAKLLSALRELGARIAAAERWGNALAHRLAADAACAAAVVAGRDCVEVDGRRARVPRTGAHGACEPHAERDVQEGRAARMRVRRGRSSPRWRAAQARRRWSAYRRRDADRDRRILEALDAAGAR